MCLQKAASVEPNDKGELTLSVLYWGVCVRGGGSKLSLQFKILRLTFCGKSSSKSTTRQIMIASLIFNQLSVKL